MNMDLTTWLKTTLIYDPPINDVVSKTHWETQFRQLILASNNVNDAVEELASSYAVTLANITAAVVAGIPATHNLLAGRASVDSHPITAITYLEGTLGSLQGQINALAASGTQADWNMATNTDPAYIKNKPTIPTTLAALSVDTANQRVSTAEKAAYAAKANVGWGTGSASDANFLTTAGVAAKNGDIYIKHA